MKSGGLVGNKLIMEKSIYISPKKVFLVHSNALFHEFVKPLFSSFQFTVFNHFVWFTLVFNLNNLGGCLGM